MQQQMQEPFSPAAALAAGKKVAPDAIHLLMMEHRKAEFYFAAYEHADAQDRDAIERSLRIDLLAHMTVEEEIFYPAAQAETGDNELIGQAYDEHEDAKRILDQLVAASAQEKPALMRELRDAITEHVDAEEGELFPLLRASKFEAVGVGTAMAIRRVEAIATLTQKPLPQ